jgi:hypothetical protein
MGGGDCGSGSFGGELRMGLRRMGLAIVAVGALLGIIWGRPCAVACRGRWRWVTRHGCSAINASHSTRLGLTASLRMFLRLAGRLGALATFRRRSGRIADVSRGRSMRVPRKINWG